jgi:DNA polymerase-1
MLNDATINKVIILDSNAVCHKAKHSMESLSYEEKKVGIIFGYFVQMLKLAKDHKSNQFAHTWDSKSSNRLKLFPAYKEKRRMGVDKTEEEIEYDGLAYEQFDMIRDEIIPAMGFKNNFHYPGFEGDDLIASIIDNSGEEQELVMVTGDEDMFQCLCDGVVMQRKKGVYTHKDFMKEYGIPAYKWAEVKAIAGCSTDEVPGIRGVGEKTAIKYLLNMLKPTTKAFTDITSQAGKEIIARNRKLVTLPFKNTPDLILQKDTKLSLDAFCDVCNKYSFQHLLKKENLSQWKRYLNLK